MAVGTAAAAAVAVPAAGAAAGADVEVVADGTAETTVPDGAAADALAAVTILPGANDLRYKTNPPG